MRFRRSQGHFNFHWKTKAIIDGKLCFIVSVKVAGRLWTYARSWRNGERSFCVAYSSSRDWASPHSAPFHGVELWGDHRSEVGIHLDLHILTLSPKWGEACARSLPVVWRCRPEQTAGASQSSWCMRYDQHSGFHLSVNIDTKTGVCVCLCMCVLSSINVCMFVYLVHETWTYTLKMSVQVVTILLLLLLHHKQGY